MKRGAPLRRRTPLARGTSTLRRTRLRARSAKQQRLYDVRVPIIRDAIERGQLCEMARRIAEVDVAQAHRCQVRAVDWHERKTRARGGSIVDPANRVWGCRSCHTWVTASSGKGGLAEFVGLVVPSWSPDAEKPPEGGPSNPKVNGTPLPSTDGSVPEPWIASHPRSTL